MISFDCSLECHLISNDRTQVLFFIQIEKYKIDLLSKIIIGEFDKKELLEKMESNLREDRELTSFLSSPFFLLTKKIEELYDYESTLYDNKELPRRFVLDQYQGMLIDIFSSFRELKESELKGFFVIPQGIDFTLWFDHFRLRHQFSEVHKQKLGVAELVERLGYEITNMSKVRNQRGQNQRGQSN